MAKTTIASGQERMTEGQIENAVNKLRDAMRTHCDEISSGVAQAVLGTKNLGMLLFAPFRERAQKLSNVIVIKVKVNRSRTPQQALDATGRAQYTDRAVVDSMPKAVSDEVEVVLFKPDLSERGGFISDDDLEKEYESRILDPVDPVTLAALNEVDPDFADEKPNGTHWKNADGKWCFAAFSRWSDGRRVFVDRRVSDWLDRCWIAGVRKVALNA